MNTLENKKKEDEVAENKRKAIMYEVLKEIGNPLVNLFFRYQNEKKYEDWTDYVKKMEELVPEGADFIKACKRPFGFEMQIKGFPYVCKITVNSKHLEWKRLVKK